MSDVRTGLIDAIRVGRGVIAMKEELIADTILAQFDVTPKPVVTDLVLGRIADNACSIRTTLSAIGELVRVQLADAGLVIVKADQP